MRDATHVTDELAQRLFRGHLPAGWVVNEFRQDYGKDYHIEYVEGDRVRSGFYVQLKGTGSPDYVEGGRYLSYPLETKHLHHYMEDARLPLFLVVYDTRQGRGYWLPVQQHLVGQVGWERGATFTLRVPTDNRTDDADSWLRHIKQAEAWMAAYRGSTAQQLVRRRICELEALDPRIAVDVAQTRHGEQLTLTARQPVQVSFSLRHGRRVRASAKATDLFGRGLPVTFSKGELVVEGSALLAALMAEGGTVQLLRSADCVAVLTAVARDGAVADIHIPGGRLAGGTTEMRYTGRLGSSPLNLAVGPLGPPDPAHVRLDLSASRWFGQPLLGASHFDQLAAFVAVMARAVTVRLRLLVEGNTVSDGSVRISDATTFSQFDRLLGFIGKARVVARHCGINPTLGPSILDGQVLRQIDLCHDLLTTGRRELGTRDVKFDLTMEPWAVPPMLQGDRVLHSMLALWDRGPCDLPFLGETVYLGRIAWELEEAELYTPVSTIRRQLRRKPKGVRVSYRARPGARYAIRRFTDEEAANHFPDLGTE